MIATVRGRLATSLGTVIVAGDDLGPTAHAGSTWCSMGELDARIVLDWLWCRHFASGEMLDDKWRARAPSPSASHFLTSTSAFPDGLSYDD